MRLATHHTQKLPSDYPFTRTSHPCVQNALYKTPNPCDYHLSCKPNYQRCPKSSNSSSSSASSSSQSPITESSSDSSSSSMSSSMFSKEVTLRGSSRPQKSISSSSAESSVSTA